MSYVYSPGDGALIPFLFSPVQNLKRPENLYYIWWYLTSTFIHKEKKDERKRFRILCFVIIIKGTTNNRWFKYPVLKVILTSVLAEPGNFIFCFVLFALFFVFRDRASL